MKKINKICQVAGMALLLLLGACGVKPDTVDAPAGVSPDPFPQTYPAPRAPDDKGDIPERYLPDYYQPAAPTP